MSGQCSLLDTADCWEFTCQMILSGCRGIVRRNKDGEVCLGSRHYGSQMRPDRAVDDLFHKSHSFAPPSPVFGSLPNFVELQLLFPPRCSFKTQRGHNQPNKGCQFGGILVLPGRPLLMTEPFGWRIVQRGKHSRDVMSRKCFCFFTKSFILLTREEVCHL